MRIDKKVYKYIDYELMHYEDNKKRLDEIREEILESSPLPPDGQPRGQGGTSNPTEQKVVKLISSVALMKIEKTVSSIDKVYDHLEMDYKNFFDWNYKKNVGIVRTCQEIGIAEPTYYRWRDKIIYMVGEEMGLI